MTMRWYDRRRFADAADYVAVALVASLPWSTSITNILVVVWLFAALPSLDWAALWREIKRPAAGLPVLLFALAVLGLLWADVAWRARMEGLAPYLKLLWIPLLMVHFRTSPRAVWTVYALAASCCVLLATSYFMVTFPGVLRIGKGYGVVVKDYISQSGFFTIGAFIALEFAAIAWFAQRHWRAALLIALSLAFLCNMIYVATSRTIWLVIPVLLVLFGLRRPQWRMAVAICVFAGVLAALAWSSSPYLRYRLESINVPTTSSADGQEVLSSSGLRLAFWNASVDIIRDAPLIGHGTGSIAAMFQHHAATHPGSKFEYASNPHNQTFAVAIQLGLVGVLVLYALWAAHLWMFRGADLMAWFGLIVAVQNVIGSLVNSHLFDFTQGWTYAICVGIAGGALLGRNAAAGASGLATREVPQQAGDQRNAKGQRREFDQA